MGGPSILLLSSPGAATQLIEHYRLGVSVETDDSRGVAAALLDLYRRRRAGTPLRLTRDGIEDSRAKSWPRGWRKPWRRPQDHKFKGP